MLSDSAYTFTLLNETYFTGSLVDAGWLVSYVLWGAAALHPSMTTLSQPGHEKTLRVSRGRLALLAVASLIAPAVRIVELARGVDLDPYTTVVPTVILFVLVIARLSGLVDMLGATLARHEEAERQRHRSEQRFGSLVQHASDVVTVVDKRRVHHLPEPLRAARVRLPARRPGGHASGRADPRGRPRGRPAAARGSQGKPAGHPASTDFPLAPRGRHLAPHRDHLHQPPRGPDGGRHRAQHARRDRAEGAPGPALTPGLPRPAHRPRQPCPVPRPRGARPRSPAAPRRADRRPVPRHRQLQDAQRQPRPLGRRRAALRAGSAHPRLCAHRRHGGTARGRRVRSPARAHGRGRGRGQRGSARRWPPRSRSTTRRSS